MSEKETIFDWHSCFYYDETSPSCLRYKKQRRGTKLRPHDRAGCLKNEGYYILRVNNRDYCVHRIIWEMFNGPIPDGMWINHIDTVRGNNKIENLEIVTPYENCIKTAQHATGKLKKNNKSGYVGVRFKITTECSEIVSQYAPVPGKIVEKSFVFKFWEFESFIGKMKEAIIWRNARIAECISQGIPYSPAAAHQIFDEAVSRLVYEKLKKTYYEKLHQTR